MNIKEKVLIVVRGVPGSGKSTLAKTLAPPENIFSTDDLISKSPGGYDAFFAAMKAAGDFNALSVMHAKNTANARRAVDAGKSPIVIDNTNLNKRDVMPYVRYARARGYRIKLVSVDPNLPAEELFKRNRHNVPLDVIQRMLKSYKDNAYTEEELNKDE